MAFWRFPVGVVLLSLAAGCTSDPTTTDEYRAMEARLAAAEDERDRLAEQVEADAELPPILAEFKAAYESADLERIRALYTEDGIFATTDDVHELYYGDNSILGTLGLDGSEFVRRASIHAGELNVFGPVMVGDRAVAFGWEWTDFASGTGLMHLRDGRIAVLELAVTEVGIDPVDVETESG